ncbi:lysophospholipid acyltransferase family protein [Marasmitruncus massiliensis]|uniref:lysophospholipid acyltransferase family protein n=1 Tax=Marasmitruncus massiliensis TaxID=1944642 RepID=UPI000C7CDC19|nr:lysophospholipid acyltransferase family protein [Marasmitruncus massiliensis]
MLYKAGRSLCMILLRILFSVKIEGKENIPGTGYILVANHRTNFDPLFVVTGIRAQVCFMAKVELFQNPLLGWLLKHLGAFPVERGKGDTGAIDWAVDLIRGGKVLGMFPEGTRSLTGAPQRPKSGAALIAMQTGADLLPCAVCYGEKLGFRTKVTVRYGKLIRGEELNFTPGTQSTAEIKAASRLIMDRIIGLLEGKQ